MRQSLKNIVRLLYLVKRDTHSHFYAHIQNHLKQEKNHSKQKIKPFQADKSNPSDS